MDSDAVLMDTKADTLYPVLAMVLAVLGLVAAVFLGIDLYQRASAA